MKYLIYVLIVLATILLVYNATVLNFDNLFEGNSAIALVGIFASLCVIVLMLILLVSRAIREKAQKTLITRK